MNIFNFIALSIIYFLCEVVSEKQRDLETDYTTNVNDSTNIQAKCSIISKSVRSISQVTIFTFQSCLFSLSFVL